MAEYDITDNLFLYPTPAGAYHAAYASQDNKVRSFLIKLLQQPKTPALTTKVLQELMVNDNEEACLELLYICQNSGWIQGLSKPLDAPSGTLEQILPELLSKICPTGKILLADKMGFYLSSHGFAHETAEEISALSAEIANVQDRRTGLIVNNMGINSHAWAIVDVFGNSQIGFWPIFIGSNRFVIALTGIPSFNQPEFVSFIWALITRYNPAIKMP